MLNYKYLWTKLEEDHARENFKVKNVNMLYEIMGHARENDSQP